MNSKTKTARTASPVPRRPKREAARSKLTQAQRDRIIRSTDATIAKNNANVNAAIHRLDLRSRRVVAALAVFSGLSSGEQREFLERLGVAVTGWPRGHLITPFAPKGDTP